ncbi:MAG: sortase [Candidatus Paceibacterales bacterium]
MSHYYYEKKSPRFRISRKKILRIAGASSILCGVIMLVYFFFPILSYQVYLSAYAQESLEVPIPKYLVANKGSSIGDLFAQGVNSLTSDYNDARRWYPNIISNAGQIKAKTDHYFLSIPSLHISNATVSLSNYDLSKNLVHYYGTSLPPQNGNAIIFGHSTLPQWFDPADYKTIFATLHTIKIGDEIDVKVDDIPYVYKVYSITIANPDDTNIFAQSYDNSYITIVTCTPPGTVWKRLVVRARLAMP